MSTLKKDRSLLADPGRATGALVTGASSGLGAEFARQLAQRGVPRVAVLARRLERLEALAGELRGIAPQVEVETIVADLSDSARRAELCSTVRSGRYDILINNAGFGSVGPFARAEGPRERAMVETNLVAPFELLQAALAAYLPAGRGLVINVCSTAAFQPMPFMATYGATKAFLVSHGVAVAAELRGSGVQVVTHCPGPTESEFHLAAGLKAKLSHLPAARTDAVVRELLEAVARGSTYHVSGLRNRLLASLVRLLTPPFAARAVAAKLSSAAERRS